ncbi:DUF4124 domain-containing protein [Marinobacter gelidimuriae]|uniref:DUF4124 domain-containing protein n=1 Tax=Marinobacter gelidimuriae TaxID=2739064 RepID=UPI000375D27A|nr:DUF4124 domain-containing protein [Marinobacter gelidimuriae]
MKPAIILAAATLLLINGAAQAEVYRQVDAQGNVTFSDQPSSGAEAIQVRPVTTITLPKMQDLEQLEQPQQEQPPSPLYELVRFVYPRNNEAFNSGNGDVEFSVISSPQLRDGHKYEVTLDSQPVGQSTSGTILVQQIDRGTHQAGVNIVNRSGIQVGSGTGITFTIHRPSRLN